MPQTRQLELNSGWRPHQLSLPMQAADFPRGTVTYSAIIFLYLPLEMEGIMVLRFAFVTSW